MAVPSHLTLTRPQLAARVHALREALDVLWSQSERDNAEPYLCIGKMKCELIQLEQQLRDQDAPQRGAVVSDAARAIAGRREG